MSITDSRLSRAGSLILIAVLAAACGPKGPPGGHGGMPPAVVAVQEVKPRTGPIEYEYPAQTPGSREGGVRARVAGILVKRNYTEGGPVTAGQSPSSIAPAPSEAVAARSEADVAAAEARYGNATRTAKRLKPLYDAHAVSQKDYDDAVSAEDVAAADVKSAMARPLETRLNLGYASGVAPVFGLRSFPPTDKGTPVTRPPAPLTTRS